MGHNIVIDYSNWN